MSQAVGDSVVLKNIASVNGGDRNLISRDEKIDIRLNSTKSLTDQRKKEVV